MTRLARYRAVISVLTRHGLGVATRWRPWLHAREVRLRSPDDRPIPVHLREALEELGATFIKMGQVLSTHPDVLPHDYLVELSRLQDTAITVEPGLIEAVVEQEFGKPIGEIFAEFERVPIAAASIGQVHAARLKTGEEVVVKVQRPGVAEQVEVDLAILQEIVNVVIMRLPNAELFDPEGLVEEFSRTILSELDYVREANNAEEFRRNFADDSRIRIPKIYWDLTTQRVITMERLRGFRLDDLAAIDASGISPRLLAERSSGLLFREVFEHGFFHADPHPGNFVVLPDGSIGAFDFGMVGRLDDFTQDCLLFLLAGAVERDVDQMIDALERLGVAVRPGRRARLRQDITFLIDNYQDRTLGSLSLSEEIDRMTTLLRLYRLRVPSELALLLKAMSMSEGVGRSVDPEFVVIEAAKPYLRQAMIRRGLPAYWGPRAARGAADGFMLALGLPRRLDRLLGRIERGDVELGWRPEGTDPLIARLNAMVNRLALSILAAAFVIGVSVLLLAYSPFGGSEWPIRILLEFGLVGLAFLGYGLFLSLLQGGRR